MTFEEFAGERMQPLLRFAAVLCGERGLAEDVVQEVLIRVHARWARIAEAQSPEAYVRKMIVNEYLSWRRSPRSWARVIPLPVVEPRGVVPDLADQYADRNALVAELARLAPQQRAVLVLRYYGGLTDAEIAVDLDCAQSTVRAHATRALAALRVLPEPTTVGRTS